MAGRNESTTSVHNLLNEVGQCKGEKDSSAIRAGHIECTSSMRNLYTDISFTLFFRL